MMKRCMSVSGVLQLRRWMMSNVIYTITTITDDTFKTPDRTVAWFSDLRLAIRAVLNNDGDMYEGGYRYAVIEAVNEGQYPAIKSELWFMWEGNEDGNYQPIPKPNQFFYVSGWSVG